MTRYVLRHALALTFFTTCALVLPLSDARGDVLTQHYDTSRTGATLGETQLTTSNVNASKFGKLFTRAVNGSVYAQPLYVEGLAMPSAGTRNVLFVATMHNYVYAFDADDPLASSPLWEVHLEPSSTLTDSNVGNACGTYKDISTEIGIVGTPVIDRAASIMYLVTFTRTGAANSAQATYAHWLHALDLRNGGERLNGPVKIAASVPGTGQGSVGGNIAFQSQLQNQRSSLLLANGNVYVAFSAYCDTGPYHGWILGYDASNLALNHLFNTTPDGGRGGLWQAGQGPALDADGNLYMMSGNGTTNIQSAPPGSSLSTAFIKLSPSLAVVDWFVPFNFATLNSGDRDLGSAGVLLMPGTNLVIGGGKEGKIYVLNPAALGGYHAGADTQITQSWQATFPSPSNVEGHIHGSIVHWASPTGPKIYVWGENDFLRAYSFNGTQFDTTPVTSAMRAGSGMPGGILSISANGSAAGSGIVWSNMPISANANQAVVPGMLRAFDASNVASELWNSELSSARDKSGLFGKFAPPTIANGHVYLATFSGQIAAYGLLASTTTLTTSGTPVAYGQAVTFTAKVTGPASGTPTGTMTFDDGTTLLANVPLDASGAAQWSAPLLTAGAHAITAAYSGDASFNPSTSAVLTQTVTKGPTTATLASDGSPSVVTNPVVLTATVMGVANAAIPSGAFTFVDGTTTLGTAAVDATGVAVYSAGSLGVGTHAIGASYGGDVSYLACDAPPFTQVVLPEPDAGSDAEAPDAGPIDDSGTNDGGPSDAGPDDAGTDDAGTSDAGTSNDAGNPNDAGTHDASARDAGATVDAGSTPDAGPRADSGDLDAGAPNGTGDSGGCSCRASSSPRDGGTAALLAFAVLATRRRAKKSRKDLRG